VIADVTKRFFDGGAQQHSVQSSESSRRKSDESFTLAILTANKHHYIINDQDDNIQRTNVNHKTIRSKEKSSDGASQKKHK
jgi:hypothetical protein